MEIEKAKVIKENLEEQIMIATSFGDTLRRVPTKDLQDILSLIIDLETEINIDYKRIMELEQELVHADEKVFYKECDVTLAENKIIAKGLQAFILKLISALKDNVNGHNVDYFVIVRNLAVELAKDFGVKFEKEE